MYLPKISIITASFNSENTITDTIDSILNQTYENIEYIIIDGGSTDKTIPIIEDNKELFKGRLKFISEFDKGIYDAWNKGLKISSGDWISFVGSDDILLKNAIAEYVNVITINTNVNFISSNTLLVKANLDPIKIIGKPWSNTMRLYNCIAHVGSLHHKSLFSQKGIYNTDYQIAGDYDFLLRCSDIIRPIYLPIVTAKAREGGISRNQIFHIAKETLKIKLNNKSRNKLRCYIGFGTMILKFYVREFLK